MLDVVPPSFRFCPFCGEELAPKIDDNKSRQYCQTCDWTYYPHVAASVTAIISNADSVLLVKRRREPFKGTWMFPSGFVEFGEHPEEALAREILEETGLKTKRADLLGVFQSPDDYRAPGHFVFFYRVDADIGEIHTDPHENEAIRWFETVGQMPEVGWQLHKRFLLSMWSEAGLRR
jgi:ADP-ribose pyrophosphatase YjhB (NUDIX family)